MYVALAAVTDVGENHGSFSEMRILGGFQSLSNANSLVQHRCGQEMTAHINSANASDDASVDSRLEHHDQDGKVDVRQKLVDSSGKVSKILRFWVQEFDLDVGSGAGGRPPKLFAVLRGRILYDRGDQDDGTTWDEEIVGVYPDIASAERSAQTCCDDLAGSQQKCCDSVSLARRTMAELPRTRRRDEDEEEDERRERSARGGERGSASPSDVVSWPWKRRRADDTDGHGTESADHVSSSSRDTSLEPKDEVDEAEGDGQWLAWVDQFSVLAS
mmetsp:Transcript_28137/g.66954  ORF Transcript_28137/g.66954 Transcript_28137/m.66954 type:complete len:273 (+) Transcript_28137:98-916(+)